MCRGFKEAVKDEAVLWFITKPLPMLKMKCPKLSQVKVYAFIARYLQGAGTAARR